MDSTFYKAVLNIKVNTLCFVYCLTEQMVTVLTQLNSLFLFFYPPPPPWGKNNAVTQSFCAYIVTAGHQSIQIHGTVMLAHVDQGPNLIGLYFSAVVHIKRNKVHLWQQLTAQDNITVINQTWQQWHPSYISKPGGFHKESHLVSNKTASSEMFFICFISF